MAGQTKTEQCHCRSKGRCRNRPPRVLRYQDIGQYPSAHAKRTWIDGSWYWCHCPAFEYCLLELPPVALLLLRSLDHLLFHASCLVLRLKSPMIVLLHQLQAEPGPQRYVYVAHHHTLSVYIFDLVQHWDKKKAVTIILSVRQHTLEETGRASRTVLCPCCDLAGPSAWTFVETVCLGRCCGAVRPTPLL